MLGVVMNNLSASLKSIQQTVTSFVKGEALKPGDSKIGKTMSSAMSHVPRFEGKGGAATTNTGARIANGVWVAALGASGLALVAACPLLAVGAAMGALIGSAAKHEQKNKAGHDPVDSYKMPEQPKSGATITDHGVPDYPHLNPETKVDQGKKDIDDNKKLYKLISDLKGVFVSSQTKVVLREGGVGFNKGDIAKAQAEAHSALENKSESLFSKPDSNVDLPTKGASKPAEKTLPEFNFNFNDLDIKPDAKNSGTLGGASKPAE